MSYDPYIYEMKKLADQLESGINELKQILADERAANRVATEGAYKDGLAQGIREMAKIFASSMKASEPKGRSIYIDMAFDALEKEIALRCDTEEERDRFKAALEAIALSTALSDDEEDLINIAKEALEVKE